MSVNQHETDSPVKAKLNKTPIPVQFREQALSAVKQFNETELAVTRSRYIAGVPQNDVYRIMLAEIRVCSGQR